MRYMRWTTIVLLVAVLSACSPETEQAITGSPEPEIVTAVPIEPDSTETAELTEAIPFDLGIIPLVQTGEVADRFREMPTRINGLIAAPPEGDNLPIAVIVHGSYPSGCPSDGESVQWPCGDEEIPQYEGFGYLLEALAEQGYVAVSINATPAYVFAFGEPNSGMRLPILFDIYMHQIAAAVLGEDVDFGVDLAGRVDLSKLVVLGHSASGEIVVRIADSRAVNTDPEEIAAGDGPVSAEILLAPASNFTDGMVMDFPFAVILPACDRDLAGLPGQEYFELAHSDIDRAFLALSVYLLNANHNRFSTQLEDETLGRASVACDDALMPAEEQQQFLVNFATRFFNWTLNKSSVNAVDIGFDAGRPAPDALLGLPVLTSLSAPIDQRLSLDVESEDAVGSVTIVSCVAGFAQAEENVDRCRRFSFNQPASPAELSIQWDGVDGRIEVPLPEEDGDLTAYDTVHMRAVVDPMSDLNILGAQQAFSLQLLDTAGHTAEVSLDGEPALAFVAGEAWNDGYTDLWDNNVLLSSIRVPLAAFAGIDLSNVQSLAFVFDQTDSGSVFLADLEFLDAR